MSYIYTWDESRISDYSIISESWVEMDLRVIHLLTPSILQTTEKWTTQGMCIRYRWGRRIVCCFRVRILWVWKYAQTSENDRSATEWGKGGYRGRSKGSFSLPGLVQGCWCCQLIFLFHRLESEWELRLSPQLLDYDSHKPLRSPRIWSRNIRFHKWILPDVGYSTRQEEHHVEQAWSRVYDLHHSLR